MKTFTLSEELVNEIAGVLAQLPYGQIAPLAAKMQEEIAPQVKELAAKDSSEKKQ